MKTLLFILLIILNIGFDSQAQLADSPWPMRGQNMHHSGMGISPHPAANILRWKFEAGSWIYSSPSIGADGTLYFGSGDGNLYAVDADGSLKWKYQTGNWIQSSPAVSHDGTVYIGSNDGYIYAVRPEGSLKWRYLTGGYVISSPAIGPDGTIYAGSDDNYLYAIKSDGSLEWKYLTEGRVQSSPAVDIDGTVVFGSRDKHIYALNSNGTLKWKYLTGDWVFSSPAIGTDGTVYVGSNDHFVYAISPEGTLKWRRLTGGPVLSSPSIAIYDITIYIGSNDNFVYALNAGGILKWRYQTGGIVHSSPVIGADGTIYVGSRDNNVHAINPDGTSKWKFPQSKWVQSSPSIGADGTLYIGSNENHLYAFYPATQDQIIPFTPVPATGISQAVVIQSILLNGAPLQIGDWVGIFDGDKCVGANSFDGSYPLTIAVWLECTVPGDSILPGGTPGNSMTFKLWNIASGKLHKNVSAVYETGAGIFGEPLTVVSISSLSGIEDNPSLPKGFALKQNRPNPFNPSTEISFTLPIQCQAKITVYDLRGRIVRIIADQQFSEGVNTVFWDGKNSGGRDVSSGVYLYQIWTDLGIKNKRMLLMR